MRQRQKPIITIGVSSLLLIFLSLCLIIFAVLSLVSARADLSLSENMARRTRIYYEAESSAADLLSSLDEALVSHYQDSKDEEIYFSSLSSDLPREENQLRLDGTSLSFAIPIDEEQQLFVQLELFYPEQPSDTFYAIKSWKVENLRDWTPDTRQNVYIQPDAIPSNNKEETS